MIRLNNVNFKARREKNMFCKYCGKELGEENTTCPFCGKRIENINLTKKNTEFDLGIIGMIIMIISSNAWLFVPMLLNDTGTGMWSKWAYHYMWGAQFKTVMGLCFLLGFGIFLFGIRKK